jgi:sterol desaturase/sphingolipid hydroxylase (fatty acid hydroxylase superfamily)
MQRIRPLGWKATSAILLISISLMSIGSAAFLSQQNVATVWASLGGLAIAAVALTVLELSLPWRIDWIPSMRDVGRDALHLGFIQGVIRPVTRLLVVSAFTGLVAALNADGALAFRPNLSAAPLVVQVVATMLVADLLFYTGHRLMHRFAALWRYHVVHHAPQSLYWLRSIRLHFVDVAFMATLNLAALSLFRVQPFATLLASVAATTMSMVHHANVRFDLRWLSFLIVPPELHRGHHSTIIDDEQSNYALVFSFWDRWFRTLRMSDTRDVGAVVAVQRPGSFLDDLVFPWKLQ